MRAPVAMLALLAIAAPAAAQDGSESSGARTTESAQRFMAQVLVRTDKPLWHSFTVYRIGGEVSNEPRAGGLVVPASGEIKAVTSETPCVTRLRLEQAQVAQLAAGETSNLQITGGRTERAIDWSKTETIEKHESKITSRDTAGQVIGTRTEYGVAETMQGGWERVTFDLPSQSERDRLAFAIEFLKSACELKSDTGF